MSNILIFAANYVILRTVISYNLEIICGGVSVSNHIFTGSAVAVVTPFCDNGVDFDALGKIIDFHLRLSKNKSYIVYYYSLQLYK